jgi:MFS family permease
MVVLDTTVMNIAIPTIQTSLKTDLPSVSWVLNAYNLMYAVLLFTVGRFADQYGRKRLFLLAMLLFSLASLGCALAPVCGRLPGTPAMSWLIGFRALQGMSAAGLTGVSPAIVMAVFPHEKRGAAHSGLCPALAGAALGDWPQHPRQRRDVCGSGARGHCLADWSDCRAGWDGRPLWTIAAASLLGRRVPSVLQGRVNAAYRFLGTGLAAGPLLGGPLAQVFGLRFAFIVCACDDPPEPDEHNPPDAPTNGNPKHRPATLSKNRHTFTLISASSFDDERPSKRSCLGNRQEVLLLLSHTCS